MHENKYMRQLIKSTKAIGSNMLEAKSAINYDQNDIVSASAMIQYYNIAYNIGMHAKERMHFDGEEAKFSANDIVLNLLLIGSKNMHMDITSDYELKEWEHIFNAMIKRYSFWHEAYFGLGKIYFWK